MENQLEQKNHEYWINRAPGYSEVNQEELNGESHMNWSSFLKKTISRQFNHLKPHEVKILDVGAGPAFLSIVLTKLGYAVTALDFAETMIEQGKENAGELAGRISFVQGNAQSLPFQDDSFDVVISRNLTWNLANPDIAYQEWNRVLKKDGMLLNFDANWYHYLFDEEKRMAYEQDRDSVANHAIEDYNIGENFDVMEKIAVQRPLSRELRPRWDKKWLSKLGMKDISANESVWKIVWSQEEKINFSSTPMFLVAATK